MNTLESIVPSLELCKKIPVGEFKDSVLVWKERIGISRDARVKIREPEDLSYKVESAEVNYFPAPTLEEILDDINSFRPWDTATFTRAGGDKTKLADFTLKWWLKLKGVEVEK